MNRKCNAVDKIKIFNIALLIRKTVNFFLHRNLRNLLLEGNNVESLPLELGKLRFISCNCLIWFYHEDE